MQIKTWLHRLTDESNPWFNAIKAEDEGEHLEAVKHYLKDATIWLKQGSSVRSALSCSCAAGCLAQTGNIAQSKRLYLEAAAMYVENADSIIGQSIRESLWSLQQAYENLIMAGDDENSTVIYNRYVSLATKISPFAGAEEAMKVLGFRKITSEASERKSRGKTLPLTGELASLIEEFTKNAKSAIPQPGTVVSSEMVLASIDNGNGGSRINEKSIVS